MVLVPIAIKLSLDIPFEGVQELARGARNARTLGAHTTGPSLGGDGVARSFPIVGERLAELAHIDPRSVKLGFQSRIVSWHICLVVAASFRGALRFAPTRLRRCALCCKERCSASRSKSGGAIASLLSVISMTFMPLSRDCDQSSASQDHGFRDEVCEVVHRRKDFVMRRRYGTQCRPSAIVSQEGPVCSSG